MAKKDMVSERKKGTKDEVFSGDEQGAPNNGPRESGGGAGETTRLASGPKGQYRTSVTDNPGNMPYAGGANSGKGNTNQDDAGTARLTEEKSSENVGDEHQESAEDQDVDDYYRALSKRRPPNYSKTMNLQTKQASLDLAPVDGSEGYVGSNTGPAPAFNYITGKKGFSEDMPVWGEISSNEKLKDEAGSSDADDAKDIGHGEDSRDEFASWKYVQGDEGLPQTHVTSKGAGDAGTDYSDEPDKNGTFGRMGGKGKESYRTDLNTQSIPSDESGDTDTDSLPKTIITDEDGGGAPLFKFSGQTDPKDLYQPKPRD